MGGVGDVPNAGPDNKLNLMAYLQINPLVHVASVHYANGFIRIYAIIFNLSIANSLPINWCFVVVG